MMCGATPTGRDPARFAAGKVKEALSQQVRIEILMTLEKRGLTTAELAEQLPGEHSIKDLRYHLQVLDGVGCLELEQGKTQDGPGVYRVKNDYLGGPLDLERPVAIEDQVELALNWREIEVDQVGEAQVAEILRNTRIEFLTVEEQTLARSRVSPSKPRSIVVGVVAFRSLAMGDD